MARLCKRLFEKAFELGEVIGVYVDDLRMQKKFALCDKIAIKLKMLCVKTA